jgi:hypothetical protein
MAAVSYSPKQVNVNGKPIFIVQNSLKAVGGYGEAKVMNEIYGSTTRQVLAQDLDTAKSKVTFDVRRVDQDSDLDITQLVKAWKQNGNANSLSVIPNGPGQNQNFPLMTLTNDPEINESPEGVVSLVWEGAPVQLS